MPLACEVTKWGLEARSQKRNIFLAATSCRLVRGFSEWVLRGKTVRKWSLLSSIGLWRWYINMTINNSRHYPSSCLYWERERERKWGVVVVVRDTTMGGGGHYFLFEGSRHCPLVLLIGVRLEFRVNSIFFLILNFKVIKVGGAVLEPNLGRH
jgi:hypothetical protein